MKLIEKICKEYMKQEYKDYIKITGQQYKIICNTSLPIEYLRDIIYPNGANGITFLSSETSDSNSIVVGMCIINKEDFYIVYDQVKSEGKYIGKCVQQKYGFYDKYEYDGIYYIYPDFDDSGTPNLVFNNGQKMIFLSVEGHFDYKLLARTIREIAYRRLESDGYVCIHSSAVQLNGKGILIVGDSAVGKTTLSLSLCKFFDAKYMTNDKTLIKDINGDLYATSFSAAVRLNYGTLNTLKMEDHFKDWNLKIKRPADQTDWKEFNGVNKLNLLPKEVSEILEFNILSSIKIDYVIYPRINMDLKNYIIEHKAIEDVLKRNICTPDDEQFPQDWLDCRTISRDKLKVNADNVIKKIFQANNLFIQYSFDHYTELLKNINSIISVIR